MGNPYSDPKQTSRHNSGLSADRLARAALIPLREKLEQWQQQVAQLHGDCFDMAARHQSCEGLHGRARQVLNEAMAEMEEARHHFATYRYSSRFADLELSYNRLVSSIRRLVGDA